MNAIVIENLNISFKDFSLKQINLSIPTGTIFGLVGTNGAGKTTLIQAIIGALYSDEGCIKVLGVDSQSASFNQLKNDIGVVLDECYYPDLLTPKEMEKFLKTTYKNWNTQRYKELLTQLKLPFDKALKDFSRGMKMKFSLVVALSHRAKLLILDEPTSGLDPSVREQVVDILSEFTRKPDHSILLSSHITSDLERLCDYIGFLKEGQLIFKEEKDKLLSEYGVVKLSEKDLNDLPSELVMGKKTGFYGVDALLKKTPELSDMYWDHMDLEDLILLWGREQ